VSVDPAIQASYRDAIARRGRDVKFRRITGEAPNAGKVDAVVKAIVMTATPDPLSSMRSGYSEREGAGMTFRARHLIVMADDLTTEGFPLPLKENDIVFLDAAAEKRRLSITMADPETRALAGAIDVIASGVQ
jgi:hypothetical protein